MRAGRSEPITAGVARQLRLTTLAVVAVAAVAIGLASRYVLCVQAQRFFCSEAQLCAAALVPGRDGDLSRSIARLQDRYPDLLAVATLDTYGRPRRIYPDRPVYRDAVAAVLAAYGGPVTTRASENGEPISVAGAVVSINGSPSPVARRVLLLLRADAYRTETRWVLLAATAVVGLAAVLAAFRLHWWFTRRVARPLRQLATRSREAMERSGRDPAFDACDWSETERLTEQFRELLQELAVREARYRGLEVESERRFRRRLRGFDRMLRRAKDKAMIDPLTRLRNRAFLEEELEPFFEHYATRGVDVAAVMMDVDNFKHYNDTHGHQHGDALLRFLGALMRGGLRPTDYAIRYGGDELLLLLPETTAEQAVTIADRLLKLFGQHVTCLGPHHNLSLSAGVASLKDDGPVNGQALVAQADVALYIAKRQGKKTVARRPAATSAASR